MTAPTEQVAKIDSLDTDILRELWEELRNTFDFLTALRERLADPDQADEVVFCEDCDVPVMNEDTTRVERGYRVVCEPCLDEYSTCECCGEYVYSNDMRWTLGDASVCESCIEHDYGYCDDCDGYFHLDYSHEHQHGNCDCEAPHQHFYVRNDGQAPLENDSRARVSLPSGVIDAEGMAKIKVLMRTSVSWDAARLVEGVGPVWQQKDGNFTKRLSRAAYKYLGVKVDPAVLSEVGNIASAHSTAVDFDIEVTRNLNLPAEDFYHEESCWWQSYGESRCALKNNGGYGLRTFNDSGNVSGRAWVMPLRADGDTFRPTLDTMTPDAFVVFNGYGALSGYAATRIVAHMAGWTYRKIVFECRPMFVNGDTGYLVAPEDVAQGYTDGSLYLQVDAHARLVDDTPAMPATDKELVNA